MAAGVILKSQVVLILVLLYFLIHKTIFIGMQYLMRLMSLNSEIVIPKGMGQ